LIDGVDDIDASWLQGKEHIGITAGASVIPLKTVEENITFSLPSELRDD